MDDQRVMQTAVRAARAAGEVALGSLGDPGFLKWKRHRDLVAGRVLDIQQVIIDAIRADFPDHSILAEESTEQPAPGADPLWIVDPIDGSVNFFQALPVFSIAIAFRSQGHYRVGVVYDPCRDELFQAIVNRGAQLNGRSIVVRQVSDGIEAWDQAVVGTDWPSDAGGRKLALSVANMIANQILALNVMGSPALGLCYVAAGRLHGYYHLDLKPWDVAGAAVILREAGGILTDAYGSSWVHSDGGYIASNDVIHGSLVRPITFVLERFKTPGDSGGGSMA